MSVEDFVFLLQQRAKLTYPFLRGSDSLYLLPMGWGVSCLVCRAQSTYRTIPVAFSCPPRPSQHVASFQLGACSQLESSTCKPADTTRLNPETEHESLVPCSDAQPLCFPCSLLFQGLWERPSLLITPGKRSAATVCTDAR